MLILSVFSVEVKPNDSGADPFITTIETVQHAEAAPGMPRDNGTGTAQPTSYREQMTETNTTTPQKYHIQEPKGSQKSSY